MPEPPCLTVILEPGYRRAYAVINARTKHWFHAGGKDGLMAILQAYAESNAVNLHFHHEC